MTTPRVVNLVPTPDTRAVAQRMIHTAQLSTGGDAVLQHLGKVSPDQFPALVAALLTATKVHKKIGRPAQPLQFSEDDRKRGYRLYRQGQRTPFAVAAYREYQRVNQARRRARRSGPLGVPA